MPVYSSIERQRCPKSRYSNQNKRMECKHKVRIDLFEKNKKSTK